MLRAIEELEQLDHVLAAEPDYNFEVTEDWAPDDTRYTDQWGLRGANGIQAEGAWDITRGEATPRIKVGIFEHNIQSDHPDLRVINGNFTPAAGVNADHGTYVGGILAAITHNNLGVAGVAQVELALLDQSSNNFASSLMWALNNNIRIVNASFYYGPVGSPAPAITAHATAIRNFGSNGGILIASAGNQGATTIGNTDDTPQFPAGYGDARNFPNINNVISVGALNENGTRRNNSNFGANSVHVYAPGGLILSTFPENRWDPSNHFNVANYEQVAQGYAISSGTSAAAPHVTGVAALLKAVNPNLTAVQIRDAILKNADAVTIQIPNPAGGTVFENQAVKRLNAFRAVFSAVCTKYTYNGGIQISSLGFSPQGEIRIPDTIDGLPVTGINMAFCNKHDLTGITIPATVTVLMNSAFSGCDSLASVNILGNITGIGWSAFSGCSSLTSITLPNSVVAIDAYAFANSGLTSITIPPGVNNIEQNTFYGCGSLMSVNLNNVKSIGDAAFGNCGSLRYITIPSSVTSVNTFAFWQCSPSLAMTWNTALVPPAGVKPYITEVNIPGGVTNIAADTFLDCPNLTTANLNNVQYIGENAFYFCPSLTSVTMNSVKTIAGDAFSFCTGLRNITVPQSATFVNNYAFWGCHSSLAITWNAALLPPGDIKQYITAVNIPAGVTAIAANAYENCTKLTSVMVPSSVTKVEADAFANTGMWNAATGVVYAGNWAVGYKGSAGVLTFASGIVGIGDWAFADKTSLTNVVFPAALKTIGAHAFEGCSNLNLSGFYSPTSCVGLLIANAVS